MYLNCHSYYSFKYGTLSVEQLVAEAKKQKLDALAKSKERLVLLQPVSFASKTAFNAHRLLRAMDGNTLLSKLHLSEQGDPTDRFYGYADMVGRCEGHSYLIYNSQKLLEQCQFSFYFQAVKNRRDILGSDWEDFDYLRQETYKGALRRYGCLDETKEKRIIKELEIIQQKGFVSYFLINYDIVNFAQHKNFFYVGRGSGANSIVAYCLAITDVDPIELDLYFERFINLYRENPPDFDLDFSWKDRDEITHYIFDTYNQPKQDHACLLATFNTDFPQAHSLLHRY